MNTNRNNIKKGIAVSSIGDPSSPKTWSGTPSAICKELESRGIYHVKVNSEINHKIFKKIVALFSKLYYLGAEEWKRGRIGRYFTAQIANKAIEKNNITKLLHMGTLDLPFITHNKKLEHYLFCDSTWHLWSKYSTDMKGYSKKLLKDAEKLEILSYNQMTHIFSISEYVKKDLINHYGINSDKITVVGTGRGKLKPYFGPKDYSKGHILFVAKGRFKDKGLDLLLKGFELALKKNSLLKLIIVGDEQYKNFVGNLPNVKVYGYVEWHQLQHFFDTATLFAMPALNEPWGLVYLEALACKTPIIGLNRNSIPEITKNGEFGFIINETAPDELANIILHAYSNPSLLKEMGEKGQEYCLKHFTWETVTSKILDKMEIEN
ncbi:glycosyltransferase family 4 protein [Neobacillus sp. YIM B06451]|uniref:glycosyltransferase family 4 protein n=1 Tax=Neobacillus sp. YIM B06451 TaxID=3070994 RepID=UPI00292E649D|nr:glycosyltransferase family 4 protein [Neobacillus sp. YIM B06451]